MSFYSYSIFAFTFGVALISILGLAKHRDRVSVRFFIFSICVCGWGFPTALWISQSLSYEQSLFFSRLSHAFNVFIPITWLHFALIFIDKKEPFKGFYLLNYLFAGSLSSASFTGFFVKGLHSVGEFKYFTSPGSLYGCYLLIFLILVPYGFYYLVLAHKEAQEQRRKQLQYLIFATLLGFLAGSTTFLPVYSKITFPMVLYVLMPLYPFLMGIALTRYGLFDVQQIADAFQREKLAVIGTMAASLNHELRNPLFIAKGRIESFKDGVERGVYPSKDQEDQKSKEVMHVAHEQLTRAMEIMQRFSDFAKPMSVKQKKEKVSLKETAEDVLKLVSNEFELKKITLNKISMNGECIQANYRQIEEIFFNLVINACHAMDSTDSKKELSLSATQSKDKVTVEIADTGPGISKENQRRIFEPFYSTKGKKGSGLGLYITKQLVERNGGKISVKSKVGEGTKFLLEFKV